MVPKSSEEAASQYREDSEVVKLFADEALVRCDGKGMMPAAVCKLYTTWSAVVGIKTINSIVLGKRLRQLGFKKTRSNGKDYWGFTMSAAGEEIVSKRFARVEAFDTVSKSKSLAVADVGTTVEDAAGEEEEERLAA